MDDRLELDSDQKKARIAALVDLQNNQGWKIILEELAADIAITEAKLFGETPLAKDETIEALRRERIDRIELRDLPKNLIEEYAEDEPDEPAKDIYD